MKLDLPEADTSVAQLSGVSSSVAATVASMKRAMTSIYNMKFVTCAQTARLQDCRQEVV